MRVLYLKEIIKELDRINQGFIGLGLRDRYYIVINLPFSQSCYILRDLSDLKELKLLEPSLVEDLWELIEGTSDYEQTAAIVDYDAVLRPTVEYEYRKLTIKKEV